MARDEAHLDCADTRRSIPAHRPEQHEAVSLDPLASERGKPWRRLLEIQPENIRTPKSDQDDPKATLMLIRTRSGTMCSVDQRLSLVTLGVSDLAGARAFYEGLGWVTRAQLDDDVVFFQTGGMIVALWSRQKLADDTGVDDTGGWGGVTLATTCPRQPKSTP